MKWWAALLLAAAACGKTGPEKTSPSPSPSTSTSTLTSTSTSTSNVTRADYVGPKVCGECHAEKYGGWKDTLHRTMNQRVEEAEPLAPFAGERVVYGGKEAVFTRVDGRPVMRLAGVEYRITRTIGTRYLQEYVGEKDGVELRLPFGWWRRAGRWLHQQYYDSWYDAEYGADGTLALDPTEVDPAPWAGRCAWCHNTYPFELRLRRAEPGHGFEQFFESTGDAPVLDTAQLVTVGISCESCHLGGREHAAGGPLRFTPHGAGVLPAAGAPDLSAGRRSALVVNTICAQCHSTPSPRHADGAVVRNSSEALDLAGSACDTARCTDCHDPHQAGRGPGAADDSRHLAACTRCHTALADPAAARAHAGHDPGDASCLDCHMPRVVQGLSDMVRTHRIGLPVTAAGVEAAGLNACNLCHLDRSIAWTLAALGDRAPALSPRGAARWGDPRAPAGDVWLDSADAPTRIAAAAAHARAPEGRAAGPARLLGAIDDPVAHTRMRVFFALEDLLGRRLRPAEYDPAAPPARRAAQVARLRQKM